MQTGGMASQASGNPPKGTPDNFDAFKEGAIPLDKPWESAPKVNEYDTLLDKDEFGGVRVPDVRSTAGKNDFEPDVYINSFLTPRQKREQFWNENSDWMVPILGLVLAGVTVLIVSRALRHEAVQAALREHAKWVIIGGAALLCTIVFALATRYSAINARSGPVVIDRWTGQTTRTNERQLGR